MALNKRVKNAYLFDNGNLVCFDVSGEQISELQGCYSIEKHQRILLDATDDCEFKGFEILPFGFIRTVKSYSDYFRNKNMSWEDIQAV